MPTQTLQLLGSYGADIAIRFDRIVHDFKDGFKRFTLVGHSAGVLRYRLVYDFLHAATDQLSVTDPEDSILKSWPDYLWDFFARRMVDGAAFNLADPRTGSTVLVTFVESALSYNFFTYKLFSSGIELEQFRDASIVDEGGGSTTPAGAVTSILLRPKDADALTSNFPAYTKTDGTQFPVLGLAYDAGTGETAYWQIRAVDYPGGNLTLKLIWYADTATSGNVIWTAAIAVITPNTDTQDVETKTFATTQNTTDSHLGTTGQRVHECSITISNLDSLAADDEFWVRISRDANAGGDTLTGDAILIEAELAYA